MDDRALNLEYSRPRKFPKRRIYVTGFSPSISKEELASTFASFGEVIWAKIEHPGRGFITFRTENEANIALLKQNRHLLKLQPQSNLCINMIRATVSKQQIFIGGFSRNIDNQKMFDHFNSLGVVGEVIIKVHQDTGISRCFGFVTFIDEEKLVEFLTSKRFHQIWGKGVEINRATSLSAQNRKSRASSSEIPTLRANLQPIAAYTHRRSRYVPLSHRSYDHFPEYRPYVETYSDNRSRSSVYTEPRYEPGYSAAQPLFYNDSRARYYYGGSFDRLDGWRSRPSCDDFIPVVSQMEKRRSYDEFIPVVLQPKESEEEKRRKISNQSNQSKTSQLSGLSSLSSQALPWMEVGQSARSRKGSNCSRHSNLSAKQESAFAISDVLELPPLKRF